MSLKCQAIETEKGELLKIISTQEEYTPCIMVVIHGTTKMFIYVPHQMQCICSFALKSYFCDVKIFFSMLRI